MPCKICKDLDVYSLEIDFNDLHGAEGECPACSVLCSGITHFIPSSNGISILRIFVDYALYVKVFRDGDTAPQIIEFYTPTGSPTIWPKIGPGRDVSTDSSSEKCMRLARSWLKKCIKMHPQCPGPSNSPLPTRVIDVGSSNSEIRLYISHGEHANYAALSHCWGGLCPMSTTRETLEDRINSIQFDGLSKTFRQAAEVTRSLGIRYLWIDSLCIIQDSPDDWALEAGKMSIVYHSATVTLLAYAASNPSQGLFPDQSSRSVLNETYHIQVNLPDGQTRTIGVRPRSHDPSNMKKISHAAMALEESKLSTRGWALQERVLSPRILFFSKEEMSWTCSTQSRCECRVRPGPAQPSIFRKLLSGPTSDQTLLRSLYMEWPLIVMEFTRKELTYQSDRLPAMSGLAGCMEKITGDRYLCGLWGSHLNFELLWYCEPSTETNGHSSRYRFNAPYAPSWSWASVSGPITYFGPWVTQFGEQNPGYQEYGEYLVDVLEPPVEVIDAAILPLSPNRYGLVRDGFIKLSGYVLPMKYDQKRKLWLPLVKLNEFNPEHVEVKYDIPSEVPEILSMGSAGSFVFLFMGTRIPARVFGVIVSDQVVCLLLRQSEKHMSIYTRCGLVINAGSPEGWQAALEKTTIVLV